MSPEAHPLHSCLPHREPLLLLDDVEAVTARGGRARLRVHPQAWYLDETGGMPAWFGLELMAQAIAACRGRHQAAVGGPTGGGYLVGTRKYRSSRSAFPAGAELAVEVRLVEEDPSGLATYHCELFHLEAAVAEATLKVILR